ncbi:hypothetical protein [Kitasatospora sp. NPDC059327]|uniref:hypothetical protein n=1 Tax=Kitasatospora sp. NPDC059327 TaxID=3346803 RepID=UPI00368D6E4A
MKDVMKTVSNGMDLSDLAVIRMRSDSVLKSLLDARREAATAHGLSTDMSAALNDHLSSGGKRMRPRPAP